MIREVVALILIGTAAASASLAGQPAGLVNYLKHVGKSYDYASRQSMYRARFGAGASYTGTAVQNIRLRNRLVAEDHAPRFVTSSLRLTPGSRVQFQLLTHQELLVESELSATCEQQDGAVVDLGAARPGVFSVRMISEHAASQGVVIITPSADGLEATLLIDGIANVDEPMAAEQAAAVEGPATPASNLQVLRQLPEAVRAFADRVRASDFENALRPALRSYAANGGISESSTTFVVCTVALGASSSPATVPVAAGLWKECGSQAAGTLSSFAPHLIEETLNQIQQRDAGFERYAESIRVAMRVAKLLQTGFSIGKDLRKDEVEDLLSAALSVADEASEMIEIDEGRMVAKYVVQQGKKIVVLIRLKP